MKKILLIGGGGHCRSVIDALLASRSYDAVGIVERERGEYAPVMGIPVVGIDADLPALYAEGWHEAFVTLGSVGDTRHRRRIAETVRRLGFALPAVIDPSAVIAADVSLGEGVFVGKRAVINAGTAIGSGAIINTGAVIEHDCRVGAFVHVSPGAVLCGQVTVGDDTHVGAGAVVRNQRRIGAHTVIGMGSVVVKDIPEGVTAYGNPCKVVIE